MKKSYPYLADTNFLKKIYGQHNKTIYTNITVLDWNERPLQQVQAKIISGNISVNGNSAVRRTANLNVFAEDSKDIYTNIDSLFSINKKIFLELGLSNNYAVVDEYKDYPIIWFPFGVYIIQSCSLGHSSSGISMSLTLNDKMCLLNGYAGGTIPASTNFDSYDTLGADGDLHTEYIRINQIIPELVNHFGGEDLNRILVEDIANQIPMCLQWRGSNPLYLWENKSNVKNSFYTTINSDNPPGVQNPGNDWVKRKIIFNYDCGYDYTDFTFPGELVANSGDSVVTVLDKIKNTLGNYEYFYDVFGNFIFREIQNFTNTSEWRNAWQDTNNPNKDLPYLYNQGLNSYMYSFDNLEQIVSTGSNPQFEMIKNDFVVWGVRTATDGLKLPCRYHLAIDKRPVWTEDFSLPYAICFDVNMSDYIKRPYRIQGTYATLDELESIVPVGIAGNYYKVGEDIYTWVADQQNYLTKLANYTGNNLETPATTNSEIENTTTEAGYVKAPYAVYKSANEILASYSTGNWRNFLYWNDFDAAEKGIETSYYWAEMYNEWPKLYDVEEDEWYATTFDSPTALDWWLDLIDDNPLLNKYSVSSIGRRTYSTTDSDCNCVFEPDIPTIILINAASLPSGRATQYIEELEELGYHVIQVAESIYNSILPGGVFNSCYQHIRQLLTNYTNYNETINVTCLPTYHLEPNTRIRFEDPAIGIDGDYLIDSISFDLSGAGTMTISGKKCIEKI